MKSTDGHRWAQQGWATGTGHLSGRGAGKLGRGLWGSETGPATRSLACVAEAPCRDLTGAWGHPDIGGQSQGPAALPASPALPVPFGLGLAQSVAVLFLAWGGRDNTLPRYFGMWLPVGPSERKEDRAHRTGHPAVPHLGQCWLCGQDQDPGQERVRAGSQTVGPWACGWGNGV